MQSRAWECRDREIELACGAGARKVVLRSSAELVGWYLQAAMYVNQLCLFCCLCTHLIKALMATEFTCQDEPSRKQGMLRQLYRNLDIPRPGRHHGLLSLPSMPLAFVKSELIVLKPKKLQKFLDPHAFR